MQIPNQGFPRYSGTDITAGVGADSFLSIGGERDPWGEQCLACLIDSLINHERVKYALPTPQAVESDHPEFLPSILRRFRQTAAVEPITRFNASDLSIPDDETLVTQFDQFSRWAITRVSELQRWLDLHAQRSVEDGYWDRMRRDGQPWVNEFYATSPARFGHLSQAIGRPVPRILYAFEVMIRGLQYMWVFGQDHTNYFSHPMRRPLLYGKGEREFEDLKTWSWGTLITQLVAHGRIKRDAEAVAETVDILRSRVLRASPEATWYGLAGKSPAEKREVIETIAAESGLPLTVQHDIRERIAGSFAVAGVAAGGLGLHTIVFGLEVGAFAVHKWSGAVPAITPKIYRKGLWEWPRLFSAD
jgi:hypothetical protein